MMEEAEENFWNDALEQTLENIVYHTPLRVHDKGRILEKEQMEGRSYNSFYWPKDEDSSYQSQAKG